MVLHERFFECRSELNLQPFMSGKFTAYFCMPQRKFSQKTNVKLKSLKFPNFLQGDLDLLLIDTDSMC